MLTTTRYLLCLLLSLLAWLPGSALAQSACTSVWGVATDFTTYSLRYLNTTTGQWSNPLLTLNNSGASGANALAGSKINGLLYYVDRSNQNLYSIDPGATTLASTLIGTIPAPPLPAVATNMVGATSNSFGDLFVYATSGNPVAPSYSYVTVAQVSVATAATVTAWTQLRTTAGDTPTLAGSGDSFIDAGGSNWIISNTLPPTLHQLNLNPGASFGQTNSPALVLIGVGNVRVGGVSTDPLTGKTYLSGVDNTTLSAPPFASVTFEVNLVSGTTTLLAQTDTSFLIADMGNCTVKPAPPTVSKTFTPTFRAVSPGTSTLQITLGNINTAAVYINQALTDTLPAGMVIAATPVLQGSCVTVPNNTVTAVAGAGSASISAGSRIPPGGCTYSFVVSAAANGSYINTIPAGSLTTTAGTNAAQAQATFQVAVNDFSIDKQQRSGTSGTYTNAQISVAGRSTVQYVIAVTNGAGSPGSGTVTFTDTLPLQITPVLTIVVGTSGVGQCSTATSVVGGRTVVSGTYTAAAPGAICSITVTAQTTITGVITTFTNVATLSPVAPSTDSNAANNSSTVTMSILPGTTLTIAKTDGKLTATAGSINSYTITVANLGPAAADGALVSDPPATGLSCTAVTCTVTGGAVCPGAPLSLATFQTTGIPITTFPSGSTAAFVLTCGVTATGQ